MMKRSFSIKALYYLCGVQLLLSVLASPALYAGIAFTEIEDRLDDSPALGAFLEDVRQRALDSGVSNFSPYSSMLICESRRSAEDGAFEPAEILADYARKMSPDFPPAYRAIAEARWDKNRALIYLPFAGYVQAFVKGRMHLASLSFMLLSNALVIVFAILSASALFVLIFFLRCFGLIYHDLRHKVHEHLPNAVVVIGVIFLFFFPLIFGFTVLWLIPLWLFVLLGYLRKTELAGAAVVFVLLLILPVMIFLAAAGTDLTGSEEARLLWKVNYDYWDKKDLDRLRSLSEQKADDADILFSLGLAYKKNGDFAEALQIYKQLTDANPENYRSLVNLGNTYLSMDRWQAAVDTYQAAVTVAPDQCAAAHFNLSQAYSQNAMLKESEQAFLKAKEMAPQSVEKSYKNFSKHFNRKVMDERLPAASIIMRVLNSSLKSGLSAENIWGLFFRPLSVRAGISVMVFLFIAGFLWLKQDRFRMAVRCTICGRPLCLRCQKDIAKDVVCTQCANFYRGQENPDLQVKQAKLRKMQLYQKSYAAVRNVLGLLFPGAALIWKGYVLSGLAMLLVSAGLFFKIVVTLGLPSPWSFLGLSNMPLVVLLAGGLFGLWLVSAVTTFKLKDLNLKKSRFA